MISGKLYMIFETASLNEKYMLRNMIKALNCKSKYARIIGPLSARTLSTLLTLWVRQKQTYVVQTSTRSNIWNSVRDSSI